MESQARLNSFVRIIKRSGTSSSGRLAQDTALFLFDYIRDLQFESVSHVFNLLFSLTEFASSLSQQLPLEICVVNIVRRVLHIIREEADEKNIDISENPKFTRRKTLTGLFGYKKEESDLEVENTLLSIKQGISVGMRELIEELERCSDDISEQASQHIHQNEVILIYGKSKTVLNFLVNAHSDRQFEVVVAEGGAELKGQSMAKTLAKAGISTTLIPDSCVYALMSRVNKVLLGAHGLMANGGLITVNGVLGVCEAAAAHKVPVIVICGLYKLSPLFPFDQDTFNETLSPSFIYEFPSGENIDYLKVSVPKYDYVPPERIELYITNLGGHNSSFTYKILADYYSPEDYNLTI